MPNTGEIQFVPPALTLVETVYSVNRFNLYHLPLKAPIVVSSLNSFLSNTFLFLALMLTVSQSKYSLLSPSENCIFILKSSKTSPASNLN